MSAEHGAGHLSGIEQTRSIRTGDGAQKHALGYAGNEVANGIGSVRVGQVQTIGLLGVDAGQDRAFAVGARLLVGAIPGRAAAGDGRVGAGGQIPGGFEHETLR